MRSDNLTEISKLSIAPRRSMSAYWDKAAGVYAFEFTFGTNSPQKSQGRKILL
jgi:hypothetical protein